MPTLRFRVRTLMIAVGVVELLIWGAMMASPTYDYYGRARDYAAQERGWRQIAARHPGDADFRSECADYFAQMAGKYRRALWRPWMPVAPDPHAPGYDLWTKQDGKGDEVAPDLHAPELRSSQNT